LDKKRDKGLGQDCDLAPWGMAHHGEMWCPSQNKQGLHEKKRKFVLHQSAAVRCLVLVPFSRQKGRSGRSEAAQLEEATRLARAIALDIVGKFSFPLDHPRPATLLGSGKVAEIGHLVAEQEIELVVVDHVLSPIQQRNLEKAWDAKVIDRTGLILEIFGARARTKEGVLQVELAHLTYQKSRLVRSWTHLERQRGGGGFLGGPGETQIEADRRILQGKINRIERDLEEVVKTRKLHRIKRQKTPYPVIALVGYTNAGKSTLFNQLTGAHMLAQDQLFATLDPTLRRVRLPHGTTAILSDTVGFISNLPTHLVAAFRATLEEVIEADVILHVRDLADPTNRAANADVIAILTDLGIKAHDPQRMMEVWNKMDMLEGEVRQRLEREAARADIPTFVVSSLTAEGLNTLTQAIEQRIAGHLVRRQIVLTPQEMGLLDWLYRHIKNNMDEKGDEQVACHHLDDGNVAVELTLPQAIWTNFDIIRNNNEINSIDYNKKLN